MKKLATLITIVFLFTIIFSNFMFITTSNAEDETNVVEKENAVNEVSKSNEVNKSNTTNEVNNLDKENEANDINEVSAEEEQNEEKSMNSVNEATEINVENTINPSDAVNNSLQANSTKAVAKSYTRTIPDGIYEIETGVDSNKALDVYYGSMISGGNVQICRKNKADCQKLKVEYVGDGYYTLTFVHSNMLLDVSNGETEDHTNVWQCRKNGADAQKWAIEDLGDGYYNIISKISNTCLTVEGGKTASYTNIEIDRANGGLSQKFKFNEVNEKIIGNRTIPDGIYEIETGVDSNKALDVYYGSMISGGNVQICRKNGADCQKVSVKYVGEGYYTLTFVHSNMLLDVSNGEIEDHTNVWQCRENGADAQKWIIKDAGNGYYNIISKQSNTYLTVEGGKTASYTNIEIDSKNGGLSQKFKFNETDKIEVGTRTIEDGIYEIETGVDSSKALDVIDASTKSGGNVQIYTKNQAKCQQLNVKYVGNGYYTLTFVHSNMLLDVSNGKIENHTNVWQCRENGADAQKWIIRDVGNGYYNIISKQSNTYLTVEGGKTANCTNIEIDSKNESLSQKFKFNKFDETYGTKTIANGIYEIETALDSNKVLDVLDAGVFSGANVQIYQRNNGNCQKVRVRYLGNGGYYSLTFIHSEMLLDVSNGETANHTNVWQCRENGEDAQKWIIKDAGNGYYNIISKLSKTYLTVAGGNTANCTNIEIDSRNDGASQKFKFNPTKVIYGNQSDFASLDEAKYPGYKERLQQLQDKYPNWTFKIVYTGLDWNTAVGGEYSLTAEGTPRSLTQAPYLNEWKSSIDDNTYDVSNNWYRASRKAVAYMMDPRSSLSEAWVFQFQNLGSSSGAYEDIEKMVAGTYLDSDSCIKAILEAAKAQNVSPFHITSRILHEQGRDGSGIMNGYEYMGQKVYNLYNINVSGSMSTGILAGARYAYSRGWFTPEASIKGGAEFLSKNYIAKGQSTLYFQKYNVVNNPLYEHQYMQNIRAANDEGNVMYRSYRDSGLLDSRFEFAIPVYENMPVGDCERPRT